VASALLGSAHAHASAAAQGATYPRITRAGENVEIDYGPGPRGNVVGGGRAVMSGGGGEDMRITRLDPRPVRSDGPIPVLAGGGEESRIVHVLPRDAEAAAARAGAGRGFP
jgi:hypothetical protein